MRIFLLVIMILCMLVGGISYTIVKVVETTDEKHESLLVTMACSQILFIIFLCIYLLLYPLQI